MSHRDSFIAALDANPSDQVTRSIFADWLEENGDGASDLILAKGLRWMAENNKYPYFNGNTWKWFAHLIGDYENSNIGAMSVSEGDWWIRHWQSRHLAEVAVAESLWDAGITK